MLLRRLVRRRIVHVAAAAAVVAGIAVAGGAAATTPSASTPASGCISRVLVVGAMPVEITPFIEAAQINREVRAEKRSFWVGRLNGNNVILTMSGIGTVNAQQTAELAYKTFQCGGKSEISAVVFSGVSGGKTNIGDVTVVDRWKLTATDSPWYPVDPAMMAVAKQVAPHVKLERRAAAGDPACACYNPNLIKPVTMPNAPKVVFGGDGATADPFNGEKFFCVPSGGDVFGCEPCKMQSRRPRDIQPFVRDVQPYLGPDFFTSYFKNSSGSGGSYDAADMETAAVAAVAAANHTPFIGFRSLSDGKGDPLHLPGFPFQFFYYRQISADNAATLAMAFLKAWANH